MAVSFKSIVRICGIKHIGKKHCTKHCLYTRQNKQCEICCYLSGITGSDAVSLVARLPTFRGIVVPSPQVSTRSRRVPYKQGAGLR